MYFNNLVKKIKTTKVDYSNVAHIFNSYTSGSQGGGGRGGWGEGGGLQGDLVLKDLKKKRICFVQC